MKIKSIEDCEKILREHSIAFETTTDDGCKQLKAIWDIYVINHENPTLLIKKVVELEIKADEKGVNLRAELLGGTLFMYNVDPDTAIKCFLCEKKLHSLPVVQTLSKKNFYQNCLKVARRLWSRLRIYVVHVHRLGSGISRFQKKLLIQTSDNIVRTAK
jgi:NAD-dependent dihydropyrimidine dehydrogenase PreA subunit